MCPRSIQVDTTGRKQCVLFLTIIDFVDVDTIRGGICDGGIETCEELLEGFALAAAKHSRVWRPSVAMATAPTGCKRTSCPS